MPLLQIYVCAVGRFRLLYPQTNILNGIPAAASSHFAISSAARIVSAMAHLPLAPWLEPRVAREWFLGCAAPYINISFRTQIKVRFTRSVLADVDRARAKKRAAEERKVLRFIESIGGGRDGDNGGVNNDDDEDVSSLSSIDSDASSSAFYNLASKSIWRTPDLRPKQKECLDKILFDEKCDGKVIVVARTGGGKSHIPRMIGSMVGGIFFYDSALIGSDCRSDDRTLSGETALRVRSLNSPRRDLQQTARR